MRLLERTRNTFGQDSLNWFDKSYTLDWIVIFSIWTLSYVPGRFSVFERTFSTKDPLISHPHTHQQIDGALNWNVAFFAPAALVLVIGALRRSLIEIHHGLLSLFGASSFSRLVTEVFKNRVGTPFSRLRPDFLARCAWDFSAKRCTGDLSMILDGRRSFPSGHSSTAWAGMAFITLFLAGHTAVLCPGAPASLASWRSSRMLALALTTAPLFWATWVALSRVEDYRHHKEDVIAGSLIGAVSALIAYLMYWRNPFSSRTFTIGLGGPRAVYADAELERSGRLDGFELTSMDDDREPV